PNARSAHSLRILKRRSTHRSLHSVPTRRSSDLDRYGTDIFTEPTIKGKLGMNAMKAKRHMYDHIVYDSTNEQKFAEQLDTNKDVDRKSTRLNSSHVSISYAVFCLKKKKHKP